MTNKKVSIFDLGRREIKAVLYTDNKGKLITEYNGKEIEDILKNEKIINPVIVYNPNEEIQKEIKKIIFKNFEDKTKAELENDKIDIEITGREFLKTILNMITNIDLGLKEDNEENNIKINKILEDPSEILKATHKITLDIFNSIGADLNETIEGVSKMSKEQFEILNQQTEEESEEAKIEREYKEKLAELKLKKSNE